MSLPGEQHSPAKRKSLLRRGFWPALSVFLVLLSPLTISIDLREASVKAEEQAKLGVTRPFALYVQNAVDAQLDQLGKVNPMALGADYYYVLEHADCTWYFWCQSNSGDSASTRKPTPPPPQVQLNPGSSDPIEQGREMALAPTAPQPPIKLPPSVHFHEMPQAARQQPAGTGIGESPGSSSNAPVAHLPGSSSSLPDNLKKQADPQAATSSPGPLFMGNWPFVLPTWRAIRGTPYALIVTAGDIRRDGFWAIGMFLSCTLIWAMLLLRAARSETPIVVYPMIIAAPLFIPLMVVCLQWVCEGALDLGLAGCLVAAGLLALAPSTALALVVGLRHLYKVPGEAVEGIEKLKSIV